MPPLPGQPFTPCWAGGWEGSPDTQTAERRWEECSPSQNSKRETRARGLAGHLNECGLHHGEKTCGRGGGKEPGSDPEGSGLRESFIIPGDYTEPSSFPPGTDRGGRL